MIKNAKAGKELTVVTENKPGTLSKVTRILAERGINIQAVSAQSAGGVGLMHFVVDEHLRAKDLLLKKEFPYKESGVILVEAEDKPGALSAIAGRLAKNKIDILNIYGSAPESYGPCLLVLSTSNNQKALVALKPKS